jgi:hypothetical protein
MILAQNLENFKNKLKFSKFTNGTFASLVHN